MDTMTKAQRHTVMSHIRSSDTKPELAIRSALHSFGFRFRKNLNGLLGKPDMVFPKYRAVVFVNGCFWHAHDCGRFRLPKSNVEFWRGKFERNRERDKRIVDSLIGDGWRVCVLWECAMSASSKKERAEKVKSAAERFSLWLEEEISVNFLEI